MISARPLLNEVQPAGRDTPWAQILTPQGSKSSAPTANLATQRPPDLIQGTAVKPASAPTSAPTAPTTDSKTGGITTPSATQVQTVPADGSPAARPKSEAELFGDQLQALSSLYETVITVLAVGLGLLATAAFAAIRFASMREAESLAREVLRGEEYRAHVADLIKEQVALQLAQVKFDLRELEDRVYALSEQDQNVNNPSPLNETVTSSTGTASKPPTSPPPTNTPTPTPTPPSPPPNAVAAPIAIEVTELAAQPESEIPSEPAAAPTNDVVEPEQENDRNPGSAPGRGK